jgi:hypothetical protein
MCSSFIANKTLIGVGVKTESLFRALLCRMYEYFSVKSA